MKGEYISKFFNKDSETIDERDILSFFSTRQEETANLEFKSGDVEINDVFKEITAFLNTEGGLLIIGAPVETKEQIGKRTIRYCLGDVTYSKFQSKDWLYQKIFSNITPSPINIYIKELSNTKGNIFLIEIPQSSAPPHQSNSDGRYYMRIDSEAKPAPHGLVQALFEKRKKPQLSAVLERNLINIGIDHLEIRIQNTSNTPADKVSFIVEIYNIVRLIDNSNFISSTEKDFGQKFSASVNSSQVLVRVISIGFDFKLQHRSQKYLVTVCFWSKETDFDSTYFIINPKDGTVTSKHWLDDDAHLLDTIKSLNE
ncbi:MAG: ATP-binding protein [Bacteroidota bacterium]|nr:ATP-binding protein [Bacteroidota bacterium]